MAGEETQASRPLTAEELQAKYQVEAETDPTQIGGEGRLRRYREAAKRIRVVSSALEVHTTIQQLSENRGGILTETQAAAIKGWEEANSGLLRHVWVTAHLDDGTFPIVEGQALDVEAAAAAGLELFEPPEAQ